MLHKKTYMGSQGKCVKLCESLMNGLSLSCRLRQRQWLLLGKKITWQAETPTSVLCLRCKLSDEKNKRKKENHPVDALVSYTATFLILSLWVHLTRQRSKWQLHTSLGTRSDSSFGKPATREFSFSLQMRCCFSRFPPSAWRDLIKSPVTTGSVPKAGAREQRRHSGRASEVSHCNCPAASTIMQHKAAAGQGWNRPWFSPLYGAPGWRAEKCAWELS